MYASLLLVIMCLSFKAGGELGKQIKQCIRCRRSTYKPSEAMSRLEGAVNSSSETEESSETSDSESTTDSDSSTSQELSKDISEIESVPEEKNHSVKVPEKIEKLLTNKEHSKSYFTQLATRERHLKEVACLVFEELKNEQEDGEYGVEVDALLWEEDSLGDLVLQKNMGWLGFSSARKKIRQNTMKESISNVAQYGGKDYLDNDMLLAVIRTSWLSVNVCGPMLWYNRHKVSALSLLHYYMISPTMMERGTEYRRNNNISEEGVDWPEPFKFDYKWTKYGKLKKDYPKLAEMLLAEAERREKD